MQVDNDSKEDQNQARLKERKKHGSQIVPHKSRDEEDDRDKRRSSFGKTLSGLFTSFSFKRKEDHTEGSLRDTSTYQHIGIALRLKTFEKLINKLTETALEVEGIFRVSAEESKIQKIFHTFSEDPDISQTTPHETANLLKLYLREAKEPLLTFNLYDELMNLKGDSLTPSTLQVSIRKLPRDNYLMLRSLIKLLLLITTKSELNKMNSENLAVLFAPALIRSRTNEAEEFSQMLSNNKKKLNSAHNTPQLATQHQHSHHTALAQSLSTGTGSSSTISSTTQGHSEKDSPTPPTRAGLTGEEAQRLAALVKQEQEAMVHSKLVVVQLLNHCDVIFPPLEEYDPVDVSDHNVCISPLPLAASVGLSSQLGSVSTDTTPRLRHTRVGLTGESPPKGSEIRTRNSSKNNSKRLSAPPMTISRADIGFEEVRSSETDMEMSLLEALNSIMPS